VFVIDDNNYYRSMRESYHRMARDAEAGFCQLHLTLTCEEAKKANSEREAESRLPEEAIETMEARGAIHQCLIIILNLDS
jgi:tRNA uridine 5-carbamoylmethylation protein Kti12